MLIMMGSRARSLLLCAFGLVCLGVHRVSSAGIDPEMIARFTDVAADPGSHPVSRQLDGAAGYETMRLGGGNIDWNPSNPHWQVVYNHVRADLEAEQGTYLASLRPLQTQARDDYLLAVARGLREQDVAAIRAYYDSPVGRRYEEFMRRLDAVFVEVTEAPAPPPTAHQARLYRRVLMMSHTMQSQLAAGPTAPPAPRYFAHAPALDFALRSHLTELESILVEYGHDLPAFAAFQKTPATLALFRAMGAAGPTRDKAGASALNQAAAEVRSRHEAQWRLLYSATP
jgi:hypothetical protein